MTRRPSSGLLLGLLLAWSGSASAVPGTSADAAARRRRRRRNRRLSHPAEAEAQEKQKYEEEVIVSASRTEQALVNAPATVTLIDSRTIENSPATNYADLLRAVPGLNVTQTSARDINLTSRAATGTLATSQLALVDGRSIYQDFFGFVAWDFLPIDPQEIKQIEVIRGPASAVWGANALTGVVNIITKTPRESQGSTFIAERRPVRPGRHGRRARQTARCSPCRPATPPP